MATASTIINRAAVELGLAAVAAPYSSTDPNFVQLRYLLESVGDDLAESYQWRHGESFTAPSTGSEDLEFDAIVMVRGLKVAWLQAHGMDTTAALADYRRSLEAALSEKGAAPVLSIGMTEAERLLDASNVPDDGYGS